MAIDSAEKRASVAGIDWFGLGITPNASPDQEWRQEAHHGYAGILAGAAVAVVLTVIKAAVITNTILSRGIIYAPMRQR